jgi:acylphosphatase
VWFRQSTAEQARMRGVQGWVRNLDDGRVETLLQGPIEPVEAVLAWIRAGGPPAARVDGVELRDGAHDERLPDAFEVRR